MATIKFFLRGNKTPSTIYIKFKHGRSIDLRTATDVKIDPLHFFVEEGKIIPSRDAIIKRAEFRIKKIEADLGSYLLDPLLANEMTIDILKEIANPKKIEKQLEKAEKEREKEEESIEAIPTTLLGYYDYYLKKLQDKVKNQEITQSSVSKYRVVRQLIARMQSDYKTKYQLKEVDLEFIENFQKWCVQNGYAPNTVGRAIKFIKTVARYARTKGVETSNQLDNIKGYTKKSDKIYLTFEELKKINETTLESECLENVKDWLLISCFTGQRVSDFMRFEKSMISEIDGIKLLEFNQVKTGHEMTIPLHDKVIQILDKRNGNFPRPISDVKYNLYVKEVCRLAGINEKLKASKMNPKTNRKEIGVFEKWELIASHVGRRSYLSNFYNKIDTSLLMAMSGHSTEKMLLEYIGKPKSEKAVALAEKMAKIDTI